MTIDEVIKIMEDPNKHEVVFENGQLLKWLRELREAKELIRQQSAVLESQSRYIEMHIDGRR